MRRRLGLVLTFCLIFTTAWLASGQQSTNQFAEIITFQIRTGGVPQFEEFMKKIVEAANKVGVEQQWGTYQVTLGGAGRSFMVSLPFEKWGAMDSWTQVADMMTDAYGEKEAAQIMMAGGATIESSETSVYMLNKELSTRYKRMERPAPLYLLIEGKVKRERMPDFLHLLSKYKAAEENEPGTGMAHRWQCVVGATPVIVTVRPFEKFADVDETMAQEQALQKMYGEVETKRLYDLQRSCLESLRSYVMAYRPDLSHSAAVPSTDN